MTCTLPPGVILVTLDSNYTPGPRGTSSNSWAVGPPVLSLPVMPMASRPAQTAPPTKAASASALARRLR